MEIPFTRHLFIAWFLCVCVRITSKVASVKNNCSCQDPLMLVFQQFSYCCSPRRIEHCYFPPIPQRSGFLRIQCRYYYYFFNRRYCSTSLSAQVLRYGPFSGHKWRLLRLWGSQRPLMAAARRPPRAPSAGAYWGGLDFSYELDMTY